MDVRLVLFLYFVIWNKVLLLLLLSTGKVAAAGPIIYVKISCARKRCWKLQKETCIFRHFFVLEFYWHFVKGIQVDGKCNQLGSIYCLFNKCCVVPFSCTQLFCEIFFLKSSFSNFYFIANCNLKLWSLREQV